MALEDDIQNVVQTARLAELTRADGDATGTVDTTLLGRVADLVEARFERLSGITYSNDNLHHRDVGIDLLLARLKQLKAIPVDEAEVKRIEDQITALGQKGRVGPDTSSDLEMESSERGADIRPWYTPAFWAGYRASRGGGAEVSDEPVG